MTTSERMWVLAETFPTLVKWANEQHGRGVAFNGAEIVDALAQPWTTTGSTYALLFLLDVWNTDAREYLPAALREWSIVSAWATWDDAHRAAALAWLRKPFFP